MPRRVVVAPKHRAQHRFLPVRRRAALLAAASLATVGVVGAGVAVADPDGADLAAQLQANAGAATDADLIDRLGRRGDGQLSRSASRGEAAAPVDDAKLDLLQQKSRSGGQVTKTEDLGSGDPKAIAMAMLSDYGWSSSEFSCLDALWTKESGWNPSAANPTSSAYGIPQALPGSKMASAGADWATNPATQIAWGLGYIRDSYGSPCGAWSKSQASGWY